MTVGGSARWILGQQDEFEFHIARALGQDVDGGAVDASRAMLLAGLIEADRAALARCRSGLSRPVQAGPPARPAPRARTRPPGARSRSGSRARRIRGCEALWPWPSLPVVMGHARRRGVAERPCDTCRRPSTARMGDRSGRRSSLRRCAPLQDACACGRERLKVGPHRSQPGESTGANLSMLSPATHHCSAPVVALRAPVDA